MICTVFKLGENILAYFQSLSPSSQPPPTHLPTRCSRPCGGQERSRQVHCTQTCGRGLHLHPWPGNSRPGNSWVPTLGGFPPPVPGRAALLSPQAALRKGPKPRPGKDRCPLSSQTPYGASPAGILLPAAFPRNPVRAPQSRNRTRGALTSALP